MKYTIRKIYQYTENVEVEAGSQREAKDIAAQTVGERNWDDCLVDCDVISEEAAP